MRHLKKGEHGASPYDAVLGSKAWTATPRSVIFFTPDPRMPDRRNGLIYPRGNYAAAGEGTRYHLEFEPVLLDDGNTEKVPRAVLSLEPAGMTLREALGLAAARRGSAAGEDVAGGLSAGRPQRGRRGYEARQRAQLLGLALALGQTAASGHLGAT